MKVKQGSRRKRWIALVAAVAILATAGGYLAANQTILWAESTTTPVSTGTTAAGTTVAIEPANVAQTAVSAAGNLELVSERSVAMQVGGTVAQVAVEVGDAVKAGDLLLKLDTVDLERTLAQAELAVESAQIALADLQAAATSVDVAQAEATLVEAQENLAEVKAGPSTEEINAANSALAAAQSAYTELAAGPSADELTQLSADLKKAEITLAAAQSAYDQIAWRNEAGMSSEAVTLQSATIDYESAKAAYAEATAGAASSELQSASSSIQSAVATRADLLNSPTAAEVATAEAQVAQAEAALAELVDGPTANEVRSAEITLQQALIDQETAQRDLDAARITAPIDGVVITLDAKVGVNTSQGAVVTTIADPSLLQLEISVAEADITNVSLDQQAEVTIDAVPGRTYAGIVKAIAPANDASASAVSYPVTVQLTDEDLTGVMTGMNAVATLIDTSTRTEGSWLVPTNALFQNGDTASVQIVRGSETLTVTVVPGSVQGEWTTVASPDLQAGDQAVGSVTSDTSQSSGMPGMGGAPPSGGVPMGGMGQ